MAICVGHDRFNVLRWDFKLFGDFRDAQAMVEIIDDGAYRHARAAQHGSAALYSRLDFDERAFRPVDFSSLDTATSIP
jgi:hypothetical protein